MVHLGGGEGGSAIRMLHPVSKRHDPEPDKSIEALRGTAAKPSFWSYRDFIGLYMGAYKYRCDGDRSAELAQGLLQRLRMIVCKPRYRQTGLNSIPATPRPPSTKSFRHSPGSQ